MNGKNIDKLFSEKLAHHEVVPPAATWETLAGALRQKRRKRRVGYWSVAAAVLLMVATTVLIVGLERESTVPVAQEQKPSPEDSGSLAADKSSTVDHQVRTSEPKPTSLPQRETSTPVVVSETSTLPVTSPPEMKEPARLEERLVTAPPALAEREIQETPLPTNEKKSTRQTYVVDASRYKKADTTTTQTAESDQPSEVTVIYQPNPSALARKKSLGQRIDKTLTFIQDHGIGFSELRSAKSHLVDKVFSKDEPEADKPPGNNP